MPVYDDMLGRLDDMLEKCSHEGIKPNDVDTIHEIVDSIYKLHKINMMESVDSGEYGTYGNRGGYGNNNAMRANGSMDATGAYGAQGRRDYQRRDNRGRYMAGRYGGGKETVISELEEKMRSLSGGDQDVIRQAIRIMERG